MLRINVFPMYADETSRTSGSRAANLLQTISRVHSENGKNIGALMSLSGDRALPSVVRDRLGEMSVHLDSKDDRAVILSLEGKQQYYCCNRLSS